MGLTDILGHDERVTSDKKIICIPYEGHKGGNRGYCSHFSVIFETAGRFLIVFWGIDIAKKGGGQIYRATTEK